MQSVFVCVSLSKSSIHKWSGFKWSPLQMCIHLCLCIVHIMSWITFNEPQNPQIVVIDFAVKCL